MTPKTLQKKLKKLFHLFIRIVIDSLFYIYKTVIKALFFVTGIKQGKTCRFYPSCSRYSKECFKKYPIHIATKKTVVRMCKCNPWNKGGIDLP